MTSLINTESRAAMQSQRGTFQAPRRAILAAALGVLPSATFLGHPGAASTAIGRVAAPVTSRNAMAEWGHFKARFLQPEGRVTDNANGGISHSEGQGTVMLLAVRFDEPEVFERALGWTRGALARPSDHLLVWRHRPGESARAADPNNATDGDLMVAWALVEAAEKWRQPAYRTLALAMARDILRNLVIESPGGATLLPGVIGFRQPGGVTVNPSYYIFPAFQALNRVLPSPIWAALETSGLQLTRNARFGRWGLVPDWVALPRAAGRPGIATGRPARFSYDAVRVPLYLVWGGHGAEQMVNAAARFWHDPAFREMPAWADLQNNQTSPYAADPGIAAVARLAVGSIGRTVAEGPAILSPTYYATALQLLVHLAQSDSTAAPGLIASR